MYQLRPSTVMMQLKNVLCYQQMANESQKRSVVNMT